MWAQEANFGVRETPDLPLVEECMDLFRQAAELYSAADDPRHEEVFIALPPPKKKNRHIRQKVPRVARCRPFVCIVAYSPRRSSEAALTASAEYLACTTIFMTNLISVFLFSLCRTNFGGHLAPSA